MRLDVSADPFWHDEVRCNCRSFLTRWGQMWLLGLSDMGFGCVPPMVRCECWACLYDMVLGCVPPMVRCKRWVGLYDMVHSMVRYKCWRRWRPTWRLGLQLAWKRDGSVEIPVTSRIEIAPMMMIQWWSNKVQWWCRYSDDPYLVMMIQI